MHALNNLVFFRFSPLDRSEPNMACRRNFKVLCKKAAADADEWYRLATFQDALKEQEGEPAEPAHEI